MSPPKMFCFLSVTTCKCYVTLNRYRRLTVSICPPGSTNWESSRTAPNFRVHLSHRQTEAPRRCSPSKVEHPKTNHLSFFGYFGKEDGGGNIFLL
jgi:hypothetical protein